MNFYNRPAVINHNADILPCFADTYSYGAMIGYLSNIVHYDSGDVRIRAVGGKAPFRKYNTDVFSGFSDIYELHEKLLWHGNAKIYYSKDFADFMMNNRICFTKGYNPPIPFRDYFSCASFAADLLLIWCFMAEKEFDKSTILIYPHGYPNADEALRDIMDKWKEISSRNEETGCYEDADEHYSDCELWDPLPLIKDEEFLKGFRFGFTYA